MSPVADVPRPYEHAVDHSRAALTVAPLARGIPSLDGLRALSVICVFLTHLPGTVGFPQGLADVTSFIGIGQYGVRAFFIISGFLITTLLLGELAKKGRISLTGFYFRRTFRIFPASYVCLLVIAFLAARRIVAVNGGDLVHGFTYTVNYDTHRAWVIGHYWSLGVEEQFYLLWPAVIVLFGARRAGWAAIAVIIAAPILRVAELHLLGSQWNVLNGKTFETTADAIAVGCLLALFREQLGASEWYRRLSRPSVAIVAMAVVIFVSTEQDHPNAFALVGHTVMNVGLAFVIDYLVRYPKTKFAVLLNSRPLSFIGVVSYSLYLWQQLFMHRHVDAWWTQFPANVALTFAVALLSYYLVERPMLRVRERWSIKMEAARTRRLADVAVGTSALA